ncbi:MAG TPA: hypothetical protein VMU51_33120 [Mycobacteriales bacterium]|nr:hypothetical protein [Mycobacteriales bacterium]
MPVVEHRRPGDEDGVDRRQGEQYDHHHEQHLAQHRHLSSVVSGRRVGGEEGVQYQCDVDPADRDRDTGDPQHDPSRPAGGDPQGEQQRDGQSRRDRDQPAGAAGWAGRVGQRVDGAGAGGAHGRNDGGGYRDAERHGGYQTGRGHGDRRRARAADEAGTGPGEQRSGQRSERQPGPGRDDGHEDILREQHGSDQPRCTADRLEQPDASGLIGQPAADQHRDTGHGEQTEQPGADHQQDLGVSGQFGGRCEDVLPGLQA